MRRASILGVLWFLSPRWLCVLWVVVFLAAACIPSAATPATEPLVVSAASNLILAFEELSTNYEQETGVPILFNFAASGQLAQQISQGAPVDLFVAANVAYVEELAAEGRILPDSVQIYARGRLTLWTRADSTTAIETVQDLLKPEIRRVAIANPEHAPYGVAARQALQRAGIWEIIQPRLVLAENVRQALQFAETGDVDIALVPLSLSINSSGGRWSLVPEELHAPINQALGVVADSPRQAEARDFAAYIMGPRGREILRRYGFVPPEEVTSP
ncbi:MAG: molybdate ABC transporter substrate-binding protein [Anaerolineae bacterium]